ncbi:Lipopolysaccharide-assembly [Formosa sp. Hel1_31_208]|uniref:LptE family protein n=1 Tax=Formosa sp. Hel1_31_208 TaxID=1798225 RepID=UPI00087CE77E|nr:LptE family protein [Formosa sp. Hel1_31_208]SDR96922.1 Lipopolysaccharide-assembly [Formosa sp. Hel1_31_208]
MKTIKYVIIFFISLITLNCGVTYSFTGVGDLKAETFQVNYFQNTAKLIEPGFDRDFTLALQDLIVNQTNLNLTNTNGDLVYEGEITEYRISPMTAQANNRAAQNRLTVSVNVRFYDNDKPDEEFEQRFSFFYDYPGGELLQGAQKETAHAEIFERLTQDIFNATLAKW